MYGKLNTGGLRTENRVCTRHWVALLIHRPTMATTAAVVPAKRQPLTVPWPAHQPLEVRDTQGAGWGVLRTESTVGVGVSTSPEVIGQWNGNFLPSVLDLQSENVSCHRLHPNCQRSKNRISKWKITIPHSTLKSKSQNELSINQSGSQHC